MNALDVPDEVRASAEASARRSKRRRRIQILAGILAIFAVAGAWQLLSLAYPTKAAKIGTVSSPSVPGWPWIFEHALPGIANYGGNGGGLTAAQGGSRGNYAGAIETIISNSAVTWIRLLVGYAVGVVVGVGGAVLLAWSRVIRVLVALPAHMLRTLPILAMIPLVQIWFGVSFIGMVAFVAYGIGVILFAGTVNAIRNVPVRYTDNASSLGASRGRIYRSVVLPAIFPELRSAIVLSLALAWSIVVGAEFLGAQSGLGYIEVQAYQFALLGRMSVIALCFLLYAAITYWVFNRATRPLVRWMPGRHGTR